MAGRAGCGTARLDWGMLLGSRHGLRPRHGRPLHGQPQLHPLPIHAADICLTLLHARTRKHHEITRHSPIGHVISPEPLHVLCLSRA